MTRYYEDLEVGDVFDCGECEITKTEIIDFANEYDPQPYHIDEEAAKETFFEELIASGMHTLSLTVRMTVTHFLLDLASMGGRGMDELRYYQPVKPGDRLSFRVEIVKKWPSESHPERGYVDLKRRVFNHEGEEVLSVITHNLVRRRNPDVGSE